MISHDEITHALLLGRMQLSAATGEPAGPRMIPHTDCNHIPAETFTARTKYGEVSLTFAGDAICSISFTVPEASAGHTSTDHRVRKIIEAIESGSGFSGLTLLLSGTGFQQLVWKALLRIPRGGLVTYADVAEAIGAPKSVRAVANAVAANRLAIIVPCHRVVPAAGGLGNYRWGADLKANLIADELQRNWHSHRPIQSICHSERPDGFSPDLPASSRNAVASTGSKCAVHGTPFATG